jgi:hypothetical protein
VLNSQVEWWKTPAANGGVGWYWLNSKTRLPWRVMMTKSKREPAIIGEYAMTYFPAFSSLATTNLGPLKELCTRSAERGEAVSGGLKAILAGGDGALTAPQRAERITQLIPGLTRSCAAAKPVRWPDKFFMTGIMTSTDLEYGPFPAQMRYDWTARAQLTRLRNPDDPSAPSAIDGLLKPGVGYDIRRHESGELSCEIAYPGVIRPDWVANGKCECRGVLNNSPAFDRNNVIQILSCPLTESSVFWVHYTNSGRPLMLRSTDQDFVGLALADYDRWTPGASTPAGLFRVPRQCEAPNGSPFKAMFSRNPTNAKNCAGCHSPAQ